jgi:hypothetical protein
MSTRDVSQHARTLFDAPLTPEVPSVLAPAWNEKGTEKLSKDFVRWCFSFGGDFRNSPDVTNLRYWAQKTKLTIHETEEPAILEAARALFFKRIDQLTRKTDAPN